MDKLLYWSLDSLDLARSFDQVFKETFKPDSISARTSSRPSTGHRENNSIVTQLSLIAKCLTEEVQQLKDFSLIQAQVIFRHGARTPINVIPGIEEVRYDKKVFRSVLPHCDYDYKVIHHSGSKAEGFDHSRVNQRYRRELLGGITVGHLTSVGMQQCFQLGIDLRRRYINQHRLLSNQFQEQDVVMRSTYILRTLESLQGVVAGLYGAQLMQDSVQPKFTVAYYNEETLYPNPFVCSCLKDITSHGQRHISTDNPSRVALIKKVHSLINYTGPEKDLDFIALRDDLVARDAHGLELPKELASLYHDIDKQASIDFVQDILGRPSERSIGLMLALGPFYHSVVSNMDAASNGNQCPKLYLYSSHDSMIMPILVSIGAYDWQWPPYATFISFELWKHMTSGEHYVKLLHNGKEITLPGRTSKLIPYSDFKEFLAPYTLSQKEYQQRCQQSKGDIEPPRVEHSLHYDYSEKLFEPSDEEKEEDRSQAPTGM